MNDTKTSALGAIERAIKAAGGQAELARRLKEHTGKPIKTGHIYYWLKSGTVPSDHCLAVSTVTGVSRQDLRPDDYWLIWPDLPAPEQQAA